MIALFVTLTAVQVVLKPSFGLWWTDLIVVVGLLALGQYVWCYAPRPRGEKG